MYTIYVYMFIVYVFACVVWRETRAHRNSQYGELGRGASVPQRYALSSFSSVIVRDVEYMYTEWSIEDI